VNQTTKEEIQKMLAQLQPNRKSRFSALFLKIGAGYAAMAVFTTAALFYSLFNLYAINRTARQIANTDLPVVTILIEMRDSLLAQESFAGKYAIFKDATFIDMFRQRKKESMAHLAELERTNSVPNIASLQQLYSEYQMASERLFAGKSRNRRELHASARQLLNALDSLYLERHGMLETVLKRAAEQQKSTTRWAIVISVAGFLLAILVAPFTIYRVIRGLRKLQKETHRIAWGGHCNYHPQVPVVEELSDLVDDFNRMAAMIKETEQMNQDTLPLTRLPGNLAIERVLDERLKSGTPFFFCHVELQDFQPFLAQYGYAKAGELLHRTGVLIHAAVTENGTAGDFAGHPGGGCFVMVVSMERVAPVCEAVVSWFDAEVIKHISPEDREAGAIQRCDRFGVQRSFPITTVAISVLDCSIDAYATAVAIARAAVDVKDSLKKVPGSNWEKVFDQTR